MPMNLKCEIVAGESYSLEFKRIPNGERFDGRGDLQMELEFADG